MRKVLPGHAQGLSQRPHGSDSGGEQERERERGEPLFNYTFCALQIFVPHFFVELVFSLVSFAFLRLWLSANKHIQTQAHTHTHTRCMELLCKTIKNGNLNAAPKSRLRKNTATVLIAVSLALFFFLSLSLLLLCV